MWNYEKRLQYPVKITQCNPQIAQVILSQFGGPDGELSASMRYLSQRYTMPYKECQALLTDIGISVTKLRIIDRRKQYITSQHDEMFPTEAFFMSTLFHNQRPEGCLERRFLTGRRAVRASVRFSCFIFFDMYHYILNFTI